MRGNSTELVGSTSRPMHVIEAAIYRGPHLFSATPMIRIQLDLGELESWPTDRLPGFSDRLLALLPGLGEHECSLGHAGGFRIRLHEGTWLGHVAEHIAIELQSLAGARVTRGKTRSVKGREGVYNVLFAYEDEPVGLLAGWLALQLVNSLLPPELRGIEGLSEILDSEEAPFPETEFDLARGVDELTRIAERTALGPTTRSLVDAARRRGIPAMRLDQFSLVQLGYGKYQRRLRASITGATSHIAVEAACDKDLTKELLAEAGVPVPRGVVVRSAAAAVEEAERLGYPVVTKPLDGNHGRGVSIGLAAPEQVRWGFEQAREHDRRVIVEQQFTGRDHRILVVGGEVVAVAERVPAHVVGDGRTDIAGLIEAANRDKRRGEGHEKVMTRIIVDDHVIERLGRAGFDLHSIPASGETVMLRATANLSTGGTAIDRTEQIHPDNAAIARRAALVLGLDVAGIDFIAPDITRSVRGTGGGIVEVNAAPGFRMHLEPSEGHSRDVARPVIRMLFPPGAPTRIPIFAITGTNGKSTTVRILAAILQKAGLRVGFTTTSGIYIDDELIIEADASGPKSARTVLRDPTVEAAVLETARGGILREGLGFDECDVGAVLNIAADHLGVKSVHTLEDLAAIKSVVVEAVRSGGCSVLNADDPLTLHMRRHAGGRLALFTLDGGNAMSEIVRRHIARDGLAVVREPGPRGGDVIVYNDGERHRLIAAAEIGATLGGIADFNVQNAMAAAAMAIAHGIEYDTIRDALSGFASSFEQNPGRLNVHDGHGFRVVLDYAHNPAGLRALTRVTDQMRPHHRRCVGMVSIPGDRRDCDIREMGEIAAAAFDRIAFRERPDGRGREPGEIIALLTEGAIAAGFDPRAIDRILDEDDAVAHCLRIARRGDLVVLTPTHYERAWAQVQAFVPHKQQAPKWSVERVRPLSEPEPAAASRREPLRNGADAPARQHV
jgi:cyanophycin synthetase